MAGPDWTFRNFTVGSVRLRDQTERPFLQIPGPIAQADMHITVNIRWEEACMLHDSLRRIISTNNSPVCMEHMRKIEAREMMLEEAVGLLRAISDGEKHELDATIWLTNNPYPIGSI